MITRLTMTIASLLAFVALVNCASGSRTENQSAQAVPADTQPGVIDTTANAQQAHTAADIHFMGGMIGHHAQAIVMAQWAPSHGASPSIQTLAGRIINAQRDEIAAMEKWLRDRRQPLPKTSAHGIMMTMNGAEHEMTMPGMLTDAQLKQLDQARGKEFDRLFLIFMIQHHRGAVTMVQGLFDTQGAAQDISVYKLASDVFADQTTEIERMQKMLTSTIFGTDTP
jgi:uncharacterized protein (DUF305 family)